MVTDSSLYPNPIPFGVRAIDRADSCADATILYDEKSSSQEAHSEPGPHHIRTNPKDGVDMVFVHEGVYHLGDSDRLDNPPHRVHIGGFWIYRTSVTVSQYRLFCNETARLLPQEPPWGWHEDHPIVNASWSDAFGYAAWADAALPIEAQWEAAARGMEGHAFPWGNVWGTTACVHSATATGDLGSTKPVVSHGHGASPCGAMDMAGNVWEWCTDVYSGEIATLDVSHPHIHVENSGVGAERHVLRGGAWNLFVPVVFRAAFRGHAPSLPGGMTHNVGFRCVVAH